MRPPNASAARRPSRRIATRLSGALAALALLLAACDDGDDATPDDVPAAQEDDVGTDAPNAADDGDDPDPSSEAVDEDPPLLDLPGVAPITLTTPASGGGPYPTLAWEAVDGAVRYSVTVHDADGAAYWAWTTTETAVVVGGRTAPPEVEDAGGPRIHEPMRWHVIARDADGRVVAQSGQRPIAP